LILQEVIASEDEGNRTEQLTKKKSESLNLYKEA